MIHLRNAGFSSAEAADVVASAMTVASWTDAGVSHHSLAIAQAAHESSWFTIDGVDRLSTFCKGVLAGTSIADIIIILAIAKVISKIELRLKQAELETQISSIDAAEHFGLEPENFPMAPALLRPAFMDDYAIPTLAPARRILAKSAATMSVGHDVSLEYGMHLNRKPGRTALLLGLNATGTIEARRVVDSLPDKSLSCAVRGGGTVSLRIVTKYKHMGIQTVASGAVMCELQARHATYNKIFSRLRGNFFENRGGRSQEVARTKRFALQSHLFRQQHMASAQCPNGKEYTLTSSAASELRSRNSTWITWTPKRPLC